MSLQHGDVLVTFTAKGNVLFGSASTAHIKTGSLLGQRMLTVDSAGSGTLHPMAVIPVSRTSSPYSLSEAISDLTTDAAGTNTETLNQSLDTLSSTLNQIAPQLGPAFDGITRLSQTLNARNQTLGELLKGAADVTGVLSQRSQQVNTLILNANDLLSVLVARREAIVRLLASTSAVAKQLSGVVHDNESKLAPSLEKLNSVTAMLEKNRDNLAKALPGLAKMELINGETVSSGFYYNPFIPNLFQYQFFQWLFDYAFGFRAYGAPGQPPDTAGPRALLPFPFNMDPGGSR
jgi:phospholipid/cholesterol/gamma-HCH transport system substrate-binding protein